jgi:hypothetical protein
VASGAREAVWLRLAGELQVGRLLELAGLADRFETIDPDAG